VAQRHIARSISRQRKSSPDRSTGTSEFSSFCPLRPGVIDLALQSMMNLSAVTDFFDEAVPGTMVIAMLWEKDDVSFALLAATKSKRCR
jgi:hypothetical protein